MNDKFLESAQRVCAAYNVANELGNVAESGAALDFLRDLCVPAYWGADGRLYAGECPENEPLCRPMEAKMFSRWHDREEVAK